VHLEAKMGGWTWAYPNISLYWSQAFRAQMSILEDDAQRILSLQGDRIQ
jgi:hypothetical protein